MPVHSFVRKVNGKLKVYKSVRRGKRGAVWTIFSHDLGDRHEPKRNGKEVQP